MLFRFCFLSWLHITRPCPIVFHVSLVSIVSDSLDFHNCLIYFILCCIILF